MGRRDAARRRPLRRRVRAQVARETRARCAAVALHPHALRPRLPLLPGAGRSAAQHDHNPVTPATGLAATVRATMTKSNKNTFSRLAPAALAAGMLALGVAACGD